MHIFAEMKVVKDFISTSETSICGSKRNDTVTHMSPSSLIHLLMHIRPRLAEYIYLRNISVKILPFTKIGRWGKSAESKFFPQFVLLLASQFLEFLVPLENSSEDRSCSNETQVKSCTLMIA